MSFMDVRMKELFPTLVSSLDLISLESVHTFLQDGEFQVNFECGLPCLCPKIYLLAYVLFKTFPTTVLDCLILSQCI